MSDEQVNGGGIRKVIPEQGWTPAYWKVSQLEDLSFRALGVHTYLMSLPDGWQISVDRIAKVKKEGRDSIRTSLKELESFGLVSREKIRDESGRICTVTSVYAVPKSEIPDDGKPASGVTSENTASPQVAPGAGNPYDGEAAPFKERLGEERFKKRDSENLPSVGSRRATTKAMPIPDDYEPTPTLRQWAWDKHRLRSDVVDSEIEIFKLHHIAKGSTMKSWDAAAMTWLARVNGYSRPASNGNGSQRPTRPSSDDRVEQALRAGRELAAEIAAGGSFGLIEGGGHR